MLMRYGLAFENGTRIRIPYSFFRLDGWPKVGQHHEVTRVGLHGAVHGQALVVAGTWPAIGG